MKMLQNHLINHIALVVDASSSMSQQPVVKVFDKELEYLKRRSVELGQETRISIYLFNDQIHCLTFDMDVMRFKSLKGFWSATGMTRLLDGVAQAVTDHKKLPELYGDHAFLMYVITDGEENRSRDTSTAGLSDTLNRLPSHWTTACLVPDAKAKHEAKKFGFNIDSIAVWDINKANAFEGVGKQFSSAVNTYMEQRAQGVRGTRSFFATLDTSKLQQSKLMEINPDAFHIVDVGYESPIREYVESEVGVTYQLGKAFYQPAKTVEIQDHKKIFVQNVHSGKLYTGTNIRELLGLPQGTAKVEPGDHKDWIVFVQSTSVNRKLFPGTRLLVQR